MSETSSPSPSSRRQFLKTALTATGAATVAAGSTLAAGPYIHTRKRYQWKMALTWPAHFPVYGEAADQLAAWVDEMSEGRLQITVYGNNELVPALQVFDAVSSGVIEMGHGSSSYWGKKLPAAQLFAKVPFGMPPQQMIAWIFAGGGLQLWEELYRDYQLLPMPIGNSGMGMAGWFNRKIDSIDDFKGLKMRIAGLGSKVVSALGGTPSLTAENEIYSQLDRGIVDAAEYGGPYHDYLMAFYKVAKYYYYPSWHEPGLNLELIVNLKAWNSLPPDLQQVLRTATYRSYLYEFSTFESRNNEYLQKLVQEKGVTLLPFPRDVLQKLKSTSMEVMEAAARQDVVLQRVWTQYEQFRKNIASWHRVSERVYADI